MSNIPAQVDLQKNDEALLKVIRRANKAISYFEDAIVIVILLIGLWFLADTIHVYYNASAGVKMPNKPPGGIAQLRKELNEDVVAWLSIDNTSISYPIMQGKDNYEYLNKDPYGEYSLAGSIFLDSRNAEDFSDDYSVVYGHHMSRGYMFGALDEFENKDYFKSHVTGELMTLRGTFKIETIAFLYTDASNRIVFDPKEDHSNLEQFIKDKAINYRNVEGAEVVALTTCRSPTSTRRAVLFVRIIENIDNKNENTQEDLQDKKDQVQNDQQSDQPE